MPKELYGGGKDRFTSKMQETTLQKLRLGKPLIDRTTTVRFRDALYPFLLRLTKTKVKFSIVPENTYEPIAGAPIIFAANHSAFMDTPIMEEVTRRRSYVLSGKQRLPFADWLFFALIGAIWVDRKDREDMKASKDSIIAKLHNGQSVLWFPEGTWNLTDNLLMLPLKWGIIDVAREAGAQIIPVALCYMRTEKVCRVKFGQPIAGALLTERVNAIELLRDEIATLRWDLLSTDKTHHHSDLAQLRANINQAVHEYPDYDFQYEQSCVYWPHTSPKDAFSHLDNLIPSKANAFLIDKRLK